MPSEKKSPLEEAPTDAEPLTLKDAEASGQGAAPRIRRRRTRASGESESEVVDDISSEVAEDAVSEVVPVSAEVEAAAELAEEAAAMELAAEEASAIADEAEVTAEVAAEAADQATANAEALEAELLRQLEEVGRRIDEQSGDGSAAPGVGRGPARRAWGLFSPRANLGRLRRATDSVAGSELTDADTWKSVWSLLNQTVDYQRDLVQRRLKGDYSTDAYGYDSDFVEMVKPLFDFLYGNYWRVQAFGVNNLPEEGGALLIANSSGLFPWDSLMVMTAVQREHDVPRLVRGLYASWMSPLPFASDFFNKMGMVMGVTDNARRLLTEGEPVLVFPEASKPTGKLFRDRYRVEPFGKTALVSLAVRANVPIIPVAVVGAEEAYPVVAQSTKLGRPLGLPYFPFTLTWPWTGLFGLLPLPSKWTIEFGAPITPDEWPPDAAYDSDAIEELTEGVRRRIQAMLYDRLKERKSIILG
ncbi:MAG: lysophospholipid acyltransferase family protein [Anaerolineae bacterium]